ncbi:unnamed protein product [Closterium sp. Naga37s-1]|nr:unnamed protein product [Closterium sp. Naga37s-1]
MLDTLDAHLLALLPAGELQAADRANVADSVDLDIRAHQFLETACDLERCFTRLRARHMADPQAALSREVTALEEDLKRKHLALKECRKQAAEWDVLVKQISQLLENSLADV